MKVTGSSTVLQVGNVEAALAFYRDVLGFAEDFRFGPYAGVSLGECSIHLCAHTIWKRPVGGGAVGIYTDEVDAYYASIQSKGAATAPADQEYGMREFVMRDPDGNVLTFGCPILHVRVKQPDCA